MDEKSQPRTQVSTRPAPEGPAKHGLLVTLFKRLLEINFLKWGVTKEF